MISYGFGFGALNLDFGETVPCFIETLITRCSPFICTRSASLSGVGTVSPKSLGLTRPLVCFLEIAAKKWIFLTATSKTDFSSLCYF